MPIDPLLAHPAIPRPLLEVERVAHVLSLSPDHVRALLRKKKLAAVRFGKRWRVDPVDLQAYIDKHRVGHNGHGA
jgi:excisionase family DNA binding protein